MIIGIRIGLETIQHILLYSYTFNLYIIMMDDKEKMLAIQTLLISVRWAFWCDERVFKARELCEQLKENWWEYADIFINSINDFISNEAESWFDWRFFRTNYKNWWYEDMQELHWLENTIKWRSYEFLSEILPLLPYPSCQFKDWVVG